MSEKDPILSVLNLSVKIKDNTDTHTSIDRLSFSIARGQTLALVGESGSGKTLTALSILRLLPSPPAHISGGSVLFDDVDLLTLPEHKMRLVRGNRIAMIFQEPGTSLNPLMPVGEQIGEGIRLHQQLDRRSVREQVLMLMETVGIPDPRRRYRSYPHQLSGGIRQRVVVATALSCRPDLLLADEPTSALDTTVQAQIVDLLSRMKRDLGMSVLLITHDLGVVAALADKVVVLYRGQAVEEGYATQILSEPLHPYTRSLLTARTLRDASAPHRFSSISPGSSPRLDGEACPFVGLCPSRQAACGESSPDLVELGEGRKVRCFVTGKFND
jgi:oligopeptide/dipeptide ABC transporter ATP-binding protein